LLVDEYVLDFVVGQALFFSEQPALTGCRIKPVQPAAVGTDPEKSVPVFVDRQDGGGWVFAPVRSTELLGMVGGKGVPGKRAVFPVHPV